MIPIVNKFLSELTADQNQWQELSVWLKSQPCIVDVSTFTSSSISKISELLISIEENGITEYFILDISFATLPLKAVKCQKFIWPEGLRYYYSFDEKKFLNVDPNRIVVRFDREYISEVQAFLEKNTQTQHIELIENNRLFILTMKTPIECIHALRREFSGQAGVQSVNPMYIYPFSGMDMIVTDEIIVQFKEHVSQQEIDKINQKYRVEVLRTNELFHTLSVPVDLDTLEVANAYQTSGLVNYSHPNFISKIIEN